MAHPHRQSTRHSQHVGPSHSVADAFDHDDHYHVDFNRPHAMTNFHGPSLHDRRGEGGYLKKGEAPGIKNR